MENTVVICAPRACGKVVEFCKSSKVQASALIDGIMRKIGALQESLEYKTRVESFFSMPGPDQFAASFDNRRG